jgi:hypothetical protein
MQLHRVLSSTYRETIQNLSTCFPDNVTLQRSATELEVIRASPDETLLYETIFKADMGNKVSSAVHKKDPEKFYARSTVLGPCLGGIEIYHQLDEEERQDLWKSLAACIRWSSLVAGAGDSLGGFDKIAQTFMAKQNPRSSDPKEMQKQLFTSLFSDPEMSGQLCETFSKPDALKSILGSLGPLFAGLGVVSSDDEEEDDTGGDEDGAADKGTAQSSPVGEDVPTTDEEDEDGDRGTSASSILKRKKKKSMKKQAAKNKHGKGKKKKKKKSALSDLLAMVKDVDLNDEDMDELQASVTSSLTGNGSDGSSFDIGAIVKAVSSGDSSAMASAISSIQANAKKEAFAEQTVRRKKRDDEHTELLALAVAAGQDTGSVVREIDSDIDVGADDVEGDDMAQRAVAALSGLAGGGDHPNDLSSMIAGITANMPKVDTLEKEIFQQQISEIKAALSQVESEEEGDDMKEEEPAAADAVSNEVVAAAGDVASNEVIAAAGDAASNEVIAAAGDAASNEVVAAAGDAVDAADGGNEIDDLPALIDL